METAHSLTTDLSGLALVVTAAVIGGVVLNRLRQPAVVGYILVGLLLGPSGFALVSQGENITFLAELGVLLLLFFIGMELNLSSFTKILRPAMVVTAVQILFSLAICFGLGLILGWVWTSSLLFAFIISLSSTAVAAKLLDQTGNRKNRVGDISLGVLICQDLVMIPMLVLITGLGAAQTGLDWLIILKLIIAFIVLFAAVKLFHHRSNFDLPLQHLLDRQPDLVPLAALAFCLLAASLSGFIGLSAPYGAFLAGLVIANSSARKMAIRVTQPVMSIFLMVFFLSIGLLIDISYIIANPGTVILVLFTVLVLKTVMNVIALRVVGEKWDVALPGGLIMAQLGEFSFVLATVGVGAGLLDAEDHRLAITIIALSLLASPFWLLSVRRFQKIGHQSVKNIGDILSQLYGNEWLALRRGMGWLRKGFIWFRRHIGRPMKNLTLRLGHGLGSVFSRKSAKK